MWDNKEVCHGQKKDHPAQRQQGENVNVSNANDARAV
jgi:hypothetical protein